MPKKYGKKTPAKKKTKTAGLGTPMYKGIKRMQKKKKTRKA